MTDSLTFLVRIFLPGAFFPVLVAYLGEKTKHWRTNDCLWIWDLLSC